MIGTVILGALVAVWAAFAVDYAIDNYKKGYGAKANPRLHY